jgi:putative ABC transport system permease protein
MFSNYLKIALRHLQKNKLYALVNIMGLAIGIASCFLIGIYIVDELSFDKFHKNGDRIARVSWHYNFGDADVKVVTTGTKVGPEFTRRFPEVQAYVRTMKYPRVLRYEDRQFTEKRFLYADSAFFSVFSFPLLKGDRNRVLDAPEKMVITEAAARKYFGNEDPIGKVVQAGTKNLVITGIAAEVPHNSQIQFDFVCSFSSLNAAKTEKYNEANYITYLLLQKADQLPSLQAKINAFTAKDLKAEAKLTGAQFSNFPLEPFSRIHLYSDLEGFEPNGDITYVYVLAAIGFLILLIAGVNYTNLSTAQSATRTAEIGMRKVMGAEKRQVVYQFLSESFLLTLIAVVFAIGLSALLLPYFNQLSGKAFEREVLVQPLALMALLAVSMVVAFAAGSYPAFVISNTRIIQVLKSGFHFTGSGSLRKSLIVLQFVISIFLIISTVVILQQLSYVQNKDLGYNREQVVVLPLDQQLVAQYDDIRSALSNNPGVLSVAGAYEEPTHIDWGDGISTKEGDKRITVNALPVDENIVRTLGLRIVAGSDFSTTDVQQFDTSGDGANLRYSFMLNEAAVKALGWKPEEAVGKTILKNREGVVKAVVKDFHFRSLHETINPLLIFLDKRMVGTLFVKISGQQVARTLQSLESTWKERIPTRPFEYHFLDEDYDALYKAEQRTASVFTTFSALAILLACLGLFAMTAYTMVRRTKEIGIRKILGASVPDILSLVSRDFLKLVAVGLVIATPLAYYAVHQWLQKFTYKIEIQWWVFAAAGILTVLIAFLTISLQAMRTAVANPVKNLRTE